FCTQYCGTLHSQMIGWVYAMTPEDYQAWAAGSTSGHSLAQNGERLFASLGCNSCHNSGPNAHGPNLAHIYGAQVQLKDGQFVTADDAFLRDTILNPTLHEVAGYAPIMPTYQGQVSEEGLIDLVEYIRRLDSQYRIEQTIDNSEAQSIQTGAAPPGTSAPALAPGTVKP
ncbi:MAG: c-type cytochrome, partial [Acidobacteriaceae bacterium]